MMKDLVYGLSMEEIIEFHTCCSQLMEHQIADSGHDWIVILNREVGIDIIFRWASFVGKVIGEDFRNTEFKRKSRELAKIIQQRFSEIGLDISLWSPVFFYLGMIYTYAKHIGFVKMYHDLSDTKLQVLSRIDPEFRELIRVDPGKEFLFIDSRKHEPLAVGAYLLDTGLLDISKIEIFVESLDQLPKQYLTVPEIVIHQYGTSSLDDSRQVRYVNYWKDKF